MTLLTGCIATVAVLMAGHRLRPRPHRVMRLTSREGLQNAATEGRGTGAKVRLTIRWIAPAAAVILVAGPAAGAAVFVARAMWPRVQAVRRRTREAEVAALAYPDFVDLLVLSIKAGCSPLQALEALVPVVAPAVRSAVAGVVHGARTGQRFADATSALHAEPPTGLGAIAHPLSDALALADRYGTPLTATLDRLGEEARAQRRRNADIAARQLPIRLSFPLVGCTLPSFVLLTIVPLLAGTFSSLPGLT